MRPYASSRLARSGAAANPNGSGAQHAGKTASFHAWKRCGGTSQAAGRPAPPPPESSRFGTERPSSWGAKRTGEGSGAPRSGALGPADSGEVSAGHLRRELYRLQAGWRPHTREERIAKCGRVRVRADGVRIELEGGKSSYKGLVRCRSKACPVCVARRRSDYAWQVSDVAAQLHAEGRPRPYLLTCTIRHGFSDDLETTGHGIRRAWQAFCSGRAWQDLRRELGASYIVSEEVTHGRNGWHPHLHVLLFLGSELDIDTLLELRWKLYLRWEACVKRAIGADHAPDWKAFDLRLCERREDYISKLGLELADPGTKRGRAGRTPIQLLSDGIDGEARALALYGDYERIMKGRRDLTWSRDLQPYRRKRERGDVTLAADIPAPLWDTMRDRRGIAIQLLEAAERGGLDAVCWVVQRAAGSSSAWQVRISTQRAPP